MCYRTQRIPGYGYSGIYTGRYCTSPTARNRAFLCLLVPSSVCASVNNSPCSFGQSGIKVRLVKEVDQSNPVLVYISRFLFSLCPRFVVRWLWTPGLSFALTGHVDESQEAALQRR